MKNYSNLNPHPSILLILSISCALIVPLLVTGPFLPDLLLSSLSIYFLYFSIRYKIFSIYQNFYLKIFIIFWLVCILSSLMSEAIFFSLKSSFFYIRIGIFALLISYLIDQHKKIIDYFYFAFLITFSSLIIDGTFQYFNGYNLIGQEILANGARVSSFFGDELILGSYMVRLLPLCIALFFVREKKHKWEFYFFPLFLILSSVLIFISGGRTSFFFLILSSMFLIFFLSRYKLIRISILIVSLFFVSLLIIKNPKLQERFIYSPIKDMGFNNSQKYIFTPSHDSLIKTAWNMFLDKPIIGHGPKLFRKKCMEQKYATGIFPCATHPHNFYIQFLAEIGIVGFCFLAGVFIYLCYLMLRHLLAYLTHKKQYLSDYHICLLAGILITVWPISTNGNFFNNHLMMIYGLQIGFFYKKK